MKNRLIERQRQNSHREEERLSGVSTQLEDSIRKEIMTVRRSCFEYGFDDHTFGIVDGYIDCSCDDHC